MDAGDDRSSATFHFVVNNFKDSVKLKPDRLFSLPCVIRNIPWKIALTKDGTSPGNNLGIYLHCFPNNEAESDCICDPRWNCSANVKLVVLNVKNNAINIVMEYNKVFHSRSTSWGYPSFIPWNKVTDPGHGYIVDDTVIIRAEVIVGTPVGIKLKVKDNDNTSKLLESERKIQSLLSELQSLKNDVASEKADVRSKMKTLETIIGNVLLQISEMKIVKRSVAQNGSNNSSMEDMRSELKDALLSLLGVKSE